MRKSPHSLRLGIALALATVLVAVSFAAAIRSVGSAQVEPQPQPPGVSGPPIVPAADAWDDPVSQVPQTGDATREITLPQAVPSAVPSRGTSEPTATPASPQAPGTQGATREMERVVPGEAGDVRNLPPGVPSEQPYLPLLPGPKTDKYRPRPAEPPPEAPSTGQATP
jgi:hypothetical protein